MKITHNLFLGPDLVIKAIVRYLADKNLPPGEADNLSIRLKVGHRADADGDPMTYVSGAEVTWDEDTGND